MSRNNLLFEPILRDIIGYTKLLSVVSLKHREFCERISYKHEVVSHVILRSILVPIAEFCISYGYTWERTSMILCQTFTYFIQKEHTYYCANDFFLFVSQFFVDINTDINQNKRERLYKITTMYNPNRNRFSKGRVLLTFIPEKTRTEFDLSSEDYIVYCRQFCF
jgi:hypothetical protein